jgi:hypothetical protein
VTIGVLIALVIAAVLLLAWTTSGAMRGRSPGIRWHGIDWQRGGSKPEPEQNDDPK